MFQRFASALFGDDLDELNRVGSRPGDGKEEEEEDEDWILVNYLAETCSAQCGDGVSGSALSGSALSGPALSGPAFGPEEEEDDDDLVMVPSPVASPPIRYASCTSLDSAADTDGGVEEEEEEEEEEEGGFLRLDVGSLEESWFVTPPPCFTGRRQPVVLETSPLENLLIEHPSMSVYAHHSPPRLGLDALPRSLDLDLLPANMAAAAAAPKAASGGKKGRRALDAARHRPEVVQRRSTLHSASCYAAALSARSGLLQPRPGNGAQRAQPLTRNGLRRLNLLRPPKAGATQLHQPSQRQLNF